MSKEAPTAVTYLVPFGVLLALIGAFFVSSRHPVIPHASNGRSEYALYEYPGRPQIEVWVSSEKFFSWNSEPVKPLEQLPARIQEFKAKYPLRFASVSGDDLTRFEEIVSVLSELKKAGFRFVTIETHVKPAPYRR